MAAGVGKTYAMVSDALAEVKTGALLALREFVLCHAADTVDAQLRSF